MVTKLSKISPKWQKNEGREAHHYDHHVYNVPSQHTYRPTTTVSNMAEQQASLSCSLSRYYRLPLHEPSNATGRFHNNVII